MKSFEIFTREMIKMAKEDAVDPQDVIEAGLKAGVVASFNAYHPCGEHCECQAIGMEFPCVCLRVVDEDGS